MALWHPRILSPQHIYFALHHSGCYTSSKNQSQCVCQKQLLLGAPQGAPVTFVKLLYWALTSLPCIRESTCPGPDTVHDQDQCLSQKRSVTTALITHLTWRVSCSQEDRWLWFDVCSQTFREKTAWQLNSCFFCWNVNKLVHRINETAIILRMHLAERVSQDDHCRMFPSPDIYKSLRGKGKMGASNLARGQGLKTARSVSDWTNEPQHLPLPLPASISFFILSGDLHPLWHHIFSFLFW